MPPGFDQGAVVEVELGGEWVLVRLFERWVRRVGQDGREGPPEEVNAETPARWPAEETG